MGKEKPSLSSFVGFYFYTTILSSVCATDLLAAGLKFYPFFIFFSQNLQSFERPKPSIESETVLFNYANFFGMFAVWAVA